MNITEALFLNKISPEKVSQDFYSIIKGFEEVSKENKRQINYFDLFILFAFYTYKPVIDEFTRVQYDRHTTFKNRIERNPDIFANIQLRYSEGISFCKKAVLYSINNQIFNMDEELNIYTIENKQIKINTQLKNIGKTFSTKSTNELFNYFEVNINEI